MCDGINHCADGSDESVGTLCQGQDKNSLLGLELRWLVIAATSGVLILCSCTVALAIGLCRKRTRNTPNTIQCKK